MTLATLLLLHGDDPRMQFVYFVASILLAATPVMVLGTIGVLVVRKIWKERHGGGEQGAGSGS
ncbi:MAG: hypothetical protein ACREMM_08685 [Gemmatimonadales bacterium]